MVGILFPFRPVGDQSKRGKRQKGKENFVHGPWAWTEIALSPGD